MTTRATLLISVLLTISPAGDALSAHSEAVRVAARADDAALAAGAYVKVEGRREEGTFRAHRVVLRDAEPVAKIEGAIESVSADRRRLSVLGFAVVLDASTRLYRGSARSGARSMLARGAWVEVKGRWSDGLLRAARIRVKDAPAATEEITGEVDTADSDSGSLIVLGRRIVILPQSTIEDERTGRRASASLADLRRDDDDGEGRGPLTIGGVLVGGRVEAGYLEEENFDTTASATDRAVLSRVQVLASSRLTDSIETYVKASLARNARLGDAATPEASLSEAYVFIHRIGGTPVSLQLGRQRFRDEREWFFDEYLDAARVHVALPRVRLEAAAAQGLFAGAGPRRSREQRQYLGSAAVDARPGLRLSGHVIARRDTARGERPTWIGGAVTGVAGSAWQYWVDAALLRGRSGAVRLRGRAASGGVTRRWSGTWMPSLTLGAAAASGDRTPDDGIDSRFRQTALEDNRGYFGGLRRIAIYGEVFDPELTNLRIATAGFGVRPTPRLGLDIIYHYAMQSAANTALPSSNLEGRLTGASRQLGQELDLVVTLRTRAGIDLDLAAGVFVPGRAVAGPARPAVFWRPQLRFYF